MRYLDEYRDGSAAQRYAETLRAIVTRPWTLMEVCGGQTHSIVRYGVDEMLPPGVTEPVDFRMPLPASGNH